MRTFVICTAVLFAAAAPAEIRGTWGCPPEHYSFILERVLAGDLRVASLVQTRPMSCISMTFEEIRLKGNPGKRVVLIPDF